MDEITSFLINFSIEKNLWEISKNRGYQCLKISSVENPNEFSSFSPDDFVFKKASQKFIFF